MGESSPVEHALLHEFDSHAAGGELADRAAKILEVAGEVVHGVDDEGVAVAQVAQRFGERRPVGVLVGERAIHRDPSSCRSVF